MKNVTLLGRLRFLQGALIVLVLGLAGAFVFRPGTAVSSLPSQSLQAQRALADVKSHLNRVSLALMAYTQFHRPELLDRIQTEGEKANRRLNDYKISCQGDPTRDLIQIDARYATLRSATLAILRADQDYAAQVDGVESRRAALDRVVADKLIPLLRLGPGRLYAKRKASDEVEKLFAKNASSAQRIQELDQQKKQLLERYQDAYASLEEALGGAEVTASDSRRFSWPWAVALALGLVLFGLMTWAIDKTLQKQVLAPLAEMAQIADAAASGDLSREIDSWRRDEVGSVAQSINRLLSVLARSENLVYHLAALVESSGDAIISQTLDGTILSWNKGAQRIYGYSAEEIKGQNISILSPHDGGQELEDVLRRVQAGDAVQPFEMVHQARGGRAVNAFVRVAAVFDSTKKVIGVSLCAEELGKPPSSPKARGERGGLAIPAI